MEFIIETLQRLKNHWKLFYRIWGWSKKRVCKLFTWFL